MSANDPKRTYCHFDARTPEVAVYSLTG